MYAGALNEMIRLFVMKARRAAAQAALDRALASGRWVQGGRGASTRRRYTDFAEFERRMVNVTFAERHIDEAVRGPAAGLVRIAPRPDGAPGAADARCGCCGRV